VHAAWGRAHDTNGRVCASAADELNDARWLLQQLTLNLRPKCLTLSLSPKWLYCSSLLRLGMNLSCLVLKMEVCHMMSTLGMKLSRLMQQLAADSHRCLFPCGCFKYVLVCLSGKLSVPTRLRPSIPLYVEEYLYRKKFLIVSLHGSHVTVHSVPLSLQHSPCICYCARKHALKVSSSCLLLQSNHRQQLD